MSSNLPSLLTTSNSVVQEEIEMSKKGRVTLPAEQGLEKEYANIVNKRGSEAVRESDGTKIPEEVKSMADKVYSKYFFTRGDQDWAKANLDELQHIYLMSEHVTAQSTSIVIPIMKG